MTTEELAEMICAALNAEAREQHKVSIEAARSARSFGADVVGLSIRGTAASMVAESLARVSTAIAHAVVLAEEGSVEQYVRERTAMFPEEDPGEVV